MTDEDEHEVESRHPRRPDTIYAAQEDDAEYSSGTQDYVDAEEIRDEDEWVDEPDDHSAEPEYEEAPPEVEPEAPFEDYEEPVVNRPPPARPGPRAVGGKWTLPDPQQSPAPQRAQQRYLPERAPPRTVRSRSVPPPRPRPEPRQADTLHFDVPPEELRPLRRELRPRNVYREFEPQTEQPQRTPASAIVRLLVMAAFSVVVATLGTLVYVDFARGPDSLLFGSHPANPAPQAASATAPAQQTTTPAQPPAAAVDQPAPTPTLADPSAAAPPAPSPSSVNDVASAATTPGSDAPTAIPAQTFSNPFNYCMAVSTVDAPDVRYSGPAIPAAVAVAVGPGVPPANIQWRCDTQQLLACNTKGGAACALTPTVDTMLSYCSQHPNARNIPAPNGSWACNGTRPVIPA